MAESEVKIALAADLARARANLGRNFDALRRDLDVPTHIKRSYLSHKAAYISGASVLGLILSKLPARKKKIYIERKSTDSAKEVKAVEKAGFLIVILQFLFKTFRPAITSFAARQLTDFLKSRTTRPGS